MVEDPLQRGEASKTFKIKAPFATQTPEWQHTHTLMSIFTTFLGPEEKMHHFSNIKEHQDNIWTESARSCYDVIIVRMIPAVPPQNHSFTCADR